MADWVRVAAAADVAEGSVLGVRVGERDVAVYHLPGGDFRASDNVCTHEYALLSDGWLEGGSIECPLHAGRFDVRTGKAMCAPVERGLEMFEVKIEGDAVMVKLPG
ncbi:MAG: non-heme iron oxygenase ferredoxin subunit [Acetobacteraceae bacterium]|nr:non-heme iron oxygenase ferredoxin subunit [Acetobacteraceae bacterium]